MNVSRMNQCFKKIQNITENNQLYHVRESLVSPMDASYKAR